MKTFRTLKTYIAVSLLLAIQTLNAAVNEAPPMLATSFYRAINLNGSAFTIDGNSWTAGNGAANFTATGTSFANQSATLSPSTDANRASMIRSSVYGNNVTAAMSAMPSGYYKIYLYVWEDNFAETISINVEGSAAVTNYNTGSAGSWSKLGPFIRHVTDGTLNMSTSGGTTNLSGIEVWSISTPPVVANPIPDHSAVVGEVFNYTIASNAFTDADAGTTLSLSAKLSNGNALPAWLSFNAGTRKFSGTPAAGDIGTITVRVTATDGDTEVSDDFTLAAGNKFYRAINVNGSSLSIDANTWEASSGASNFSMTGSTFSNQSVTLIPATDANRATMIRSSAYNNATVNLLSVPAGIYDIYVYTWEDNWSEATTLSIEGTAALSNVMSGNAGEWKKLGPFRRTITDGAINVGGSGALNISGVEVHRASTGDTPLTVTVFTQGLTLAAGQSALFQKSVTPDNGSNQSVTWSSSNTSIATVDATGLVRAVAAGTATITATSTLGAYSGTSTLTVTGAGANVLANPEFDNGLSGWYIIDVAGTPANTATVVQNAGLSGTNALYVDIKNTATDVWRYVVRTPLPFRIEVGRSYRISFMAKAQANRNITVNLIGLSTNASYSYNNIALTTTAQTKSVTFTCNDSGVNSESAFSLEFYLSIGALNDVWFDNVMVEDVTGITQVSSVSVSPATLNINVGATSQLAKTITPSNATNQEVSWSSSNPAVATVNASGLVTAVSNGTATITVTTENGGKVATSTVNVSSVAVTGITPGPANVNVPAGNTVKLVPVIAPANATNQNVTWTSANTSIATVDAQGMVTAVAKGLTTITATTVSGNFTATTNLYVLPASGDFIANGEFNNGTANWQLTDTTTPTGANASVVTNASMSGANTLRVDVQNNNNTPSSLQLSQTLGRRIAQGRTYRITFMAKAESSRQVSLNLTGAGTSYFAQTFNLTTSTQRFSVDYTCSDSGVASEASFYLRLYLAHGVVSDVWFDDVTMTDITPYAAVTGVSVSPATVTLSASETLQLTATLSPANATNTVVSWSSSNATVASVSAEGLVSGGDAGEAVITVTTSDGSYTATSHITVNVNQAASLEQVLERFAFQYRYDNRKRMSHKKVPGADWVYMVYDDRDRLVMTQDGVQRSLSPREWTFTKYDALNRPVLTGIYQDGQNKDQAAMQTDVDAFYVAAVAPGNTDDWFETTGQVVHGYTNNSFPKVSTPGAYLTATYYDDYTFKADISNSAGYNYDNNQLVASGSEKGQPENNFTRVKGQVTGSKVKNLETGDWYYTVNYYDDRYRVIQSIAANAKGGINKVTNVYDFTGKVLRTRTDHSIASGPAVATERRMSYDHAGRLLQTDHKTLRTGSEPFVTLAKQEYNELGQLIKKGLHSTDNGSTFKQQVDYRYNIRGWLTRINDSDLATTDNGPTDYFGMRLGYNDNLGLSGTVTQYNGNISAMKYSANLGLGLNDAQLEIFEPTQRGYAFRYDALNRLQHADHHDRTLGWNASTSYDENGLSYDMNGNIMTLARSGKLGANMDALSYQYQGNRLLSVTDTGDDEEGFKDGNQSGTDYLYDANGNMKTDLNKEISLITYNHLNLPAKVQKNTGEYIRYYYDATGTKLRQEVYNASNQLQKKSDYIGEFFYENDTLRFVNHEECRVVINEQSPEYQYMLKDHLGNVRVTFTGKESTDTYTATMESSTQTQEQQDFTKYNSTVNDLLDHTDAGTTYNRVLVLNGGYNGQVGLAKSFAVMPGDKISAKAYAKYTGAAGQASALGSFAAALTSAFGLTPTSIVDGPTAYSALSDIGGILASGDHPGDEEGDPKAFLNILVFDKNYTLVDFGFDQLGEEFEQVGATKTAHDVLTVETTVRQAGYVYVFLSNEEPYELQVGFDDYEVKHEQSGVVQMEEYYPFGLTFNSYQRENSLQNKFKFQGQEHIDDLNLGWDSFKWRNHQPDIGRFFNLDPLSEKYYYNSPYAFSENKVVAHRELEGLEAELATYGIEPIDWVGAMAPQEQQPAAVGGDKVLNGVGNMIFGTVGAVGSAAYAIGTEGAGAALGGGTAFTFSLGEVAIGMAQVVDGLNEMSTGQESSSSNVLQSVGTLPGLVAAGEGSPHTQLIDAGAALLPGALTGGNIKQILQSPQEILSSKTFGEAAFGVVNATDAVLDVSGAVKAVKNEVSGQSSSSNGVGVSWQKISDKEATDLTNYIKKLK